MQILNQALRHATDGFIGILDMFGFEDSKPSQLEQLCINLSSETMQHFYNTHIFKSSIESCREEGIASDVVIDYIDNVPCIDLISSLVSFFKFIRGHSSITSSKRWVGGVRKWQFLMIYSTINHQRGEWVGLKRSKT